MKDFKLHRNGKVTFWNVYEQGWVCIPAANFPDHLLATLNDSERERIARHALRHGERGTSHAVR